MKTIPLSQGQFSIVDDEDYAELSKHEWFADFNKHTNSFYAKRNVKVKNKSTSTIVRMHRIIMRAPKGMHVDHINHNTIDNRKHNLRIVTNSQNQMNKKKQTNNTSGVTGVGWHSRDKIWRAEISVDGKTKYLGSFILMDKAIEIRKAAEEKYFGKHSYNNSVEK